MCGGAQYDVALLHSLCFYELTKVIRWKFPTSVGQLTWVHAWVAILSIVISWEMAFKSKNLLQRTLSVVLYINDYHPSLLT